MIRSLGRARILGVAASVGLLVGPAFGTGSAAFGASAADCAPYAAYQGHSGTTVTALGSIQDAEAAAMNQAWADFSSCTGITITYTGSSSFESDLQTQVDAGTPPDLAFISQPGLLAKFASSGALMEASADLTALAQQNYSADWVGYGTIDGKFYAAPFGANVKSFVWYSPSYFKTNGYQVPSTWEDMISLSDTIAAGGVKPWCAGFESGGATGWPATDWVEDTLLRTAGTTVYDQWLNHTIAFNDPQIVAAVDRAGTILRNEAYVNGGIGDVKSIATTAFQAGGLPILTDECAMHKQASFYASMWPTGTEIGPDGDVYAFYYPASADATGKPVEGAGEFTGAFSSRPEVQAVQSYLATADFANSRATAGSWVSANKGLDLANVTNPIDKLSVQLLQDPKTEFRFDASDQMPAAVGAGTFWTGMVDWINGKDTTAVLDAIESSWPN